MRFAPLRVQCLPTTIFSRFSNVARSIRLNFHLSGTADEWSPPFGETTRQVCAGTGGRKIREISRGTSADGNDNNENEKREGGAPQNGFRPVRHAPTSPHLKIPETRAFPSHAPPRHTYPCRSITICLRTGFKSTELFNGGIFRW